VFKELLDCKIKNKQASFKYESKRIAYLKYTGLFGHELTLSYYFISPLNLVIIFKPIITNYLRKK